MIFNALYNIDPYKSLRVKTRVVKVGNISIGGDNPVRLQSMCNTSTLDTEATVAQAERIIRAGGELVRMSTASMKEVENMATIKELLRSRGYNTPLVADTHFKPELAVKAAQIIEKVRINPGNFIRSEIPASEKDYALELAKTEEKLLPLIEACRKHNTAIRIGSNHGSLAARIIHKYGDTPRGMVMSALEFLQIFRKYAFHDIVLSMKSSNTRIMIQAYRLLMHEMLKSGEVYPLHLGVTEAGAGDDGRIKSATGIGALLLDGLGDTIRVSLTEDPENEIPVAKALRDLMPSKLAEPTSRTHQIPFDPFNFTKRICNENILTKGTRSAVVIGKDDDSEFFVKNNSIYSSEGKKMQVHPVFVKSPADLNKSDPDQILFIDVKEIHTARKVMLELSKREIKHPVIAHFSGNHKNTERFISEAAAKSGLFLADGLADGIHLDHRGLNPQRLNGLGESILQASRARMFKTEFISCPGCGRTLFDLQKQAEKIRNKLSHLKGLRIGIMGCIVNGPGEMADADYGYVGSGKGKITLYKNREVVKRNIPESEALEELINLIKKHGDWVEA